jgi:hypothetical protein
VNDQRGPARPPDGDQVGDHDEYDVLAAGWALHALEPDEEARFTAHLAGCAACRGTAEELEAILGELSYAAPSVEPPEGLLDRLKAAAAADTATEGAATVTEAAPVFPAPDERDPDERDAGGGDPGGRGGGIPGVVVPLRPRRSVRDRAVRWVAAAAAAVALVLAGWNVVLHREADQQRRIVAEREAWLVDVVQGQRVAALTPTSGERRPVAFVFARDGQLEVVTDGVEQNRPGSTSLWLWGQWGSSVRPLARFDVDTGQMALHRLGTVPAGMDSADAFAVSLEPGTAKPVKPSRIVANGVVS